MGTNRSISGSAETLTTSVPDLSFAIEEAEALRYAITPTLAFRLRIRNASVRSIQSVLLRCQVQIDVLLREYSEETRRLLADLFGTDGQWPQTLHSVCWANVSAVISAFDEECTSAISLPCTFDFNVAATKYLSGLQDGDIPLSFLFSGTIFYIGENDRLQVSQIPWDKEATYRLPIRVWGEMMEHYYPNTAWLCLQRDAFDRLNAFRIQNGLPTFEQAIERALP